MEAFKFHQSQQYFKTLAQVVADEDLLSKPPIVVISEKFCGFEGRSNTGEVLA